MPVKDTLTLDEYNGLGENDRQIYMKTGGENGQPETYDLHPLFKAERAALTQNNNALKTEKQTAANALKAFQDLGLSAEQIAELQQAKQAAEDAKLTEEQKRTREIETLKGSHTRELDTVKNTSKQREEFLMSQLRKSMVTTAAEIAIEKANPIKGGAKALLPHVIEAMEMIEDGEGDARQFVTRMIDVKNNRTPLYVGSDLMNVEQFVEQLKNTEGFGGLFAAEGVGGGGAGQQSKTAGAQGKGVTMKRSTFDGLSPEAQRAHVIGGGKIVD
ncbi:MAG: hypothetical protein V7638_3829 [Acidobacteriota bacterium]|jgi:hypothetical protein